MNTFAHKVVGLAVAVVVAAPGVAAGAPKPKTDPLEPMVITAPFADPSSTGGCGIPGSCTFSSEADGSGYVYALVSAPAEGYSSGSGFASASLAGVYRLPERVTAVDITVEIGMNAAVVEDIGPFSSGAVTLYAQAGHSRCDACTASGEVTVIESGCLDSAFGERTFQVTMRMTGAGDSLPAGYIDVRSFLRAMIQSTAVNAWSGGEGTVQRMVFAPVR